MTRLRALAPWAALFLAAFASIATSPSRSTRNFPRWEALAPGEGAAGCSVVAVLPVASGKEGLGLHLEVASARRCSVRVDAATLRFSSGLEAPARELPPALELGPDAAAKLWLAFPFDGDERWNDEDREATLELALTTSEGPTRLTFRLRNEWKGFHRTTDRVNSLPDDADDDWLDWELP